jgi:hypothetical protein
MLLCLATAADIPQQPLIHGSDIVGEIRTHVEGMQIGQPGNQIFEWMRTGMLQEINPQVSFPALRQQLPATMAANAEGVWLLSFMNYEYPWNLEARHAVGTLLHVDKVTITPFLERLLTPPAGVLNLEPPSATNQPATQTSK